MKTIQITAVELKPGHVALGYCWDDQTFTVRIQGECITNYSRNEITEIYGDDATMFCMATFGC